MKSLIVGMGIGQLYRHVLTAMGAEVRTVDSDPTKMPDYLSVEDALSGENYDTVHICTPNWTHESLARLVAPHARIVFVEKPGLETDERWRSLVADFPGTRFMMVKNNQYRENIDDLRLWAKKSDRIVLRWCNRNRVPNAGTWFTDRTRAWGGVSRDLMPHLLSIALVLSESPLRVMSSSSGQRWQLSDLSDTEYGTVNPNGIYDVDDHCTILLESDTCEFDLVADWRNNREDDRCIEFWSGDHRLYRFELGLCPESAYANMIDVAFRNQYNQAYWYLQLEQDVWIHQQMSLPSQ